MEGGGERDAILQSKVYQPLKRKTKIAADDTLIFLLLFFKENKAWSFM